jgi:SnoaL-like polyketide cyclase
MLLNYRSNPKEIFTSARYCRIFPVLSSTVTVIFVTSFPCIPCNVFFASSTATWAASSQLLSEFPMISIIFGRSEVPYVQSVPTASYPALTGGIGRDGVHNFYKNHFVGKMPDDTKVQRISRTVGKDQAVDELIFSFTHNREFDFILPGIIPTGKYVEVPLVAIVKFDGGKITHEHIYWDQASVLAQIGLIDTKSLPIMGIE